VICFDVLGTRKCQNFKFLTKSRFTTNRTCYTLLNFRKNPTGGVSIEMAEPILGNVGNNEDNNCKPDHNCSQLLCHWLVKDK
jgi:hypothetical protein